MLELQLPRSRQRARWYARRIPYLLLVALGATCLVVPLVGVFALLMSRVPGWAQGGLSIIPMLAILRLIRFVEQRRIGRWWPGFRDAVVSQGFAQAAAPVVEDVRSRAHWLAAPELARGLARAGLSGLTVRIGPANPKPITPLGQPFEARLLSQRDQGFAELAAAADAMAASGKQLPESPSDRRAARRRQVAFVFSAMMITAFYFLALQQVWYGRFHVIALGASVGLALGAVGYVSNAFRVRWLIVPGGVLLRRLRLRGPAALHVVSRRTGVLIAVGTGSSWQVSVADAEACAVSGMTDKELEIVLRAWVSPLPPPAVETLSDLQ